MSANSLSPQVMRRLLSGLLLAVLCVLGVGAPLTAQKIKPEEEETAPRPIKKIPRIDDEEPAFRLTVAPVNLKREAELSRHAAVRELFRALAVPHDKVHFLAGRFESVEPLGKFYDPKSTAPSIDLTPLDAKGKTLAVPRNQIARIEYYETMAVILADQFLEKAKDLPRMEAHQQAEKALAEVLRFHVSAVDRGLRQNRTDWEDVDRALRTKLLDVRLKQLESLETKDWLSVQEMAGQLADIYPNQARVRGTVIRVRARQIDQTLAADKVEVYVQARQSLEQLERLFTNTLDDDSIRLLRQRLEKKAEALAQKARELVKSDPAKAVDQLRTAESIWPSLQGLQKLREDLRIYPILNVGVRHLPEYISPAAASVDSERLALDLLFESLVRPVGDPAVGQRFEPLLVAGNPKHLPLGRQFEIVRDARWFRDVPGEPAIDREMDASDVLATVVCQRKWPGCSAEWKDLLADARVGDRFSVRLTLQQGYVDPLAVMSFKILPAGLPSPDDLTFARRPYGTGPYQYAGPVKEKDGREYARFLANPAYARRDGKLGLPLVKEIRFYAIRDAVADFQAVPLHMLIDLPTQQIKVLASPQAKLDQVTTHTLRSRRVWFLAANHRKPSMQNEDLRRAIGLAIDRDKILDLCFRDKDEGGRKHHRALSGPYPADSWAYNPSPLLDPFKPDQARTHAARLSSKSVTLKYPDDLHPGIQEACKEIQQQVEKTTGIKIELKGLPLRKLREAVEQAHDYELAYWFWDHADESYWLWPLFDPAGIARGGRNFLGPVNDPELDRCFREARDHRQFSEVQARTHQIHLRVFRTMPLIPLWQLDCHVAIRNDVKTIPPPAELDPLAVFGQVEGWKLEKP